MKRAITLGMLFIVGCSSTAGDDSGTTEDALYGYLWDDANSYNTHVVGSIAYDQTVTGVDCINPSFDHEVQEQYKPSNSYCALSFQADAFDRVSLAVENKNVWGTQLVQAYVFDQTFHQLAKAKFVGSDTGHNSDEKIELNLSPGRQLRKSGKYYVVFAKYAMRDSSDLKKYKEGDAFTVRLHGTRNADIPVALDHLPLRPGFYSAGNAQYFVDVEPPTPPASPKDLDAWRAHVYQKANGCASPNPATELGKQTDFNKLECDDKSCWFSGGKVPNGGSLDSWHLRAVGDDLDASFHDQQATTVLHHVRNTTDAERHTYASKASCVVSCPDTPSQHYDNPCAGGRAPGWCYPDWTPPFGFESPLVLNVNGGNEIEWLGHGVSFDLDGHGAQPLDWVNARHPFLALDLNGNGKIDDGGELFGTATKLGTTGKTAADGFAALAQYDDNHDHVIDDQDITYGSLVLWFDRNSNGVSDSGELSPLTYSGVEAIKLAADPTKKTSPSATGAFITSASTFTEHRCGMDMFIADVWFPSR